MYLHLILLIFTFYNENGLKNWIKIKQNFGHIDLELNSDEYRIEVTNCLCILIWNCVSNGQQVSLPNSKLFKGVFL